MKTIKWRVLVVTFLSFFGIPEKLKRQSMPKNDPQSTPDASLEAHVLNCVSLA
jgi:hypothetical protein